MRNNLHPVWLIAKRELRDQFRDWRILFPLIVLTLVFPFLMNEVAFQAVAFANRYGGNLIVDRLVPFSVLIIGFFPITVSLVVALESFVGEKERGTIEPLLSSPMEDWQLYAGKLLVGISTPLFASFFSIIFYLIMVSYQDLNMPQWPVIAQLFGLTAAHAILMTSAAIVISVQSTSVKAANLLASFIVVPVAMLMQGETVMLFWGTDDVLWWAVLAVLVMSFLLVRLGIAHFNREYLLGREIDTINIRLTLQKFWTTFKGQAASVPDWYRRALRQAVAQLFVPFAIVLMMAIAGIWFAYDWTMNNVPVLLKQSSQEDISKLVRETNQLPDINDLRAQLSVSNIFTNNVQAMLIILLAGLVSFSVLGILVYLINIGVIGGLLGVLQIVGMSPVLILLAGLLPHGIFEIPALMLSAASVLRIGAVLVTPQLGRSMGDVIVDLLADWTKVFIGLVIPLLAIAALVETYITPAILLSVLK
jgi:uncharacterized membrane protein SpoIIM required for sporulation/ABC-type transport system involved in multi-copper enzyme maturation permease subunit